MYNSTAMLFLDAGMYEKKYDELTKIGNDTYNRIKTAPNRPPALFD
jgi:hypothetical protein